MSIRALATACCPPFLRPTLERIESSPVGYRLARGAFWSLFGAVIARTLGFASFVIVARVLGKAGYGEFGIIQSTVGMFGIFAGFGLGQTATKYIAELRETDAARAGRIMGMAGIVAILTGVVMAILLWAFAPWLADHTLANPALAPLLRIGAIIIVFEAMNGAQLGALSGFEAFRTIAKINIWAGLASFPCMLAGVYLGDLQGAVWGLAANRAFNWLLNHIALRREARRTGVPFALAGSRNELAVLWHFSLPSMLAGALVAPTVWLCNAMVVNQPDGYDQMGIFQATNTFRTMLFFIGNTLSAPLLPMLANMIGSGQHNERLARINMISTWALGALPATVFFAVPELAEAMFGKDYAGREFVGTFLLTVFCASVVIYKQGLARVLSAHGLMWWGMLSNFVWAVLLIACTWLLLAHGAFGYAIAWTVAYVINTVVFIPLFLSKRLVPLGTLVSPEAIAIWSLLIGGMTLAFAQVPLIWRLISLIPVIPLMSWLFWRLLMRDSSGASHG